MSRISHISAMSPMSQRQMLPMLSRNCCHHVSFAGTSLISVVMMVSRLLIYMLSCCMRSRQRVCHLSVLIYTVSPRCHSCMYIESFIYMLSRCCCFCTRVSVRTTSRSTIFGLQPVHMMTIANSATIMPMMSRMVCKQPS